MGIDFIPNQQVMNINFPCLNLIRKNIKHNIKYTD